MSKTIQKIEIRDDVWRRVEALAERRGVSADEIVQAALVQLFSRKKPTMAPSAAPAKPAGAAPAKPAPAKPPASRPSPPAPSSRRPPPPPGTSGTRRMPRVGSSASRLPAPGGGSSASRLPPPSRQAATPATTPPLYLFCEGNWYEIDQDEFVIGRGQKYSDLAIRDANISRRHAAIVRRNGGYYVTDLGSTNGVEFNGERVDNHLIRDGTTYYLCDHELRFSFTPPG